MKRLLPLLTLLSLFAISCNFVTSRFSPASSSYNNSSPGEPVTLSQTQQSDALPNTVIPYGAGSEVTLSNLRISNDGSTIQGKVDFTRKGAENFLLAVVLRMPKDVLVGYYDPDTNLSIHLPSGTVLFGIDGWKYAGTNQGTISFSMNGNVFQGYNVIGEQGTAYAFTVPGQVNPQTAVQGDLTDKTAFQANSNVVEARFNLR
jgi:hypothetical protein